MVQYVSINKNIASEVDYCGIYAHLSGTSSRIATAETARVESHTLDIATLETHDNCDSGQYSLNVDSLITEASCGGDMSRVECLRAL